MDLINSVFGSGSNNSNAANAMTDDQLAQIANGNQRPTAAALDAPGGGFNLMPSNAPFPTSDGSLPPTQDFGDYYNKAGNAGFWNGLASKTGPGSIIGTIAGAIGGQDSARLNSPMTYLKMLSDRAATQGQQLDLGQTIALMNRMGYNVNPNNIMSSFAPRGPQSPQVAQQTAAATTQQTQQALQQQAQQQRTVNAPGVPGNQNPATYVAPALTAGGYQPAPVAAPQGGSAPAPSGAPTGNPADALRANYGQLAQLMVGLPKFMPQAVEMMKLARAGLPDGTVPLPSGQVGDSITGKPVNTDVGTLLAQRAGQTATAQEKPRVAGEEAIQAQNAALQRGTDLARIQNTAKYDTVNGFDTSTGLPATASKLDVINGTAKNFAPGTNPYFAGQQAEIKQLQDTADNADQGMQIASQVANAANGIYTGKFAGTAQDLRKYALALSQLTGDKVPDSVIKSTSKFEQLKFSAQELVGIASHSISPRIAMNIYNQIASIKPGDASSMQGLRDIVTKQLMPAMMRQKAMLGATSAYYRANPLRNDAASAVPPTLPLENFSVKTDLGQVQPGDFFIDPNSGNIRQRPQ